VRYVYGQIACLLLFWPKSYATASNQKYIGPIWSVFSSRQCFSMNGFNDDRSSEFRLSVATQIVITSHNKGKHTQNTTAQNATSMTSPHDYTPHTLYHIFQPELVILPAALYILWRCIGFSVGYISARAPVSNRAQCTIYKDSGV
jgi:hypothetical protein